MKTQMRRLELILRVIDPDWFYVISVWKSEIVLQGNFSPEKAKFLIKLKFSHSFDCNGNLDFNRGVIRIVLT
jgi:hypothetical protein